MERFTREDGLAGKILVGVIAWALGAVLMLTSTLVAAQQIDERVAVITTEVSPIDKDLDSVVLAETTNSVAREILEAAKPLSAQAGQVIDATEGIMARADSINSTAGQINSSVDSISGHVRSINANALSINGSVRAINGTAKSINETVRSINGNVGSINGTVKGIEGNVRSILGVATEIRGPHEVQGFGTGVAGINRRADAVIALVQGIKSDTGNILSLVRSIDESAKSIDQQIELLP